MKSHLKSFSIYGLFGTVDVHIPFDQDVKILMGENGIGKTQILSILYYALSGNAEQLNKFNFKKIKIEYTCGRGDLEFNRGDDFPANKEEFEKTFNNMPEPAKVLFSNIFGGVDNVKSFIGRVKDGEININDLANFKLPENIKGGDKVNILLDILKGLLPQDNFANNRNACGNLILYFPTYRRIETDLQNLGYSESEINNNFFRNSLINFGMEDVEERFQNYTDNIDKLSKEGFSKISGEILSQLVKGFPELDKNLLAKIEVKDIEIILARVGQQISNTEKQRIIDLVQSKKMASETDKSLLYFLQKLIEVYDLQRVPDNTIKQFRDVCNKYLINKKVIYDESNIAIYLQMDGVDERLSLKDLSSGEKQIISIFSKVYLTEEKDLIIIFDEPELSLSIFWQKELLPDILKSNNCALLIAATHSPFIFENELDKYTIGLNQYIEPTKPEKVTAK